MIAPLKTIPSHAWRKEYASLLDNEWLRKKCERRTRWQEHVEYIDANCPEIKTAEPRTVIDLGPGLGELLEIARTYGHDVLGVDAENGAGGMGSKYLRLSQLMSQRQQIPIEYVGLMNWLAERDPNRICSAVLVNSRGSIEQMLCEYMNGPPHDTHQMCNRLKWIETNETRDAFIHVCECVGRILVPGGCFLVHANGTETESNMQWYDKAIRYAAEEAGLIEVFAKDCRLHKWRKDLLEADEE